MNKEELPDVANARIGWPEVAAMIGGGIPSAQRLARTAKDFPKPLRISRKLTTFDREAVREWVKRHEGTGQIMQSVRGAAEEQDREKRMAAVDPKVRARSERAGRRNAATAE